jgi:F-type H+-transporting ATPase subunit b
MFFFFAADPGSFNPMELFLDFQNNIINWCILFGCLVWLWRKHTPAMFESRKLNIQTALQDAATARQQGEQLLLDQQARVANQDQEAAKILAEAKSLAAELKQQIIDQTAHDIADLKQKMDNRILNERQLMITEMRSAAASAAIQLTKEVLPTLMNETVKKNLLNQFMEQLDSATSGRSTISSDLFDAKSVR